MGQSAQVLSVALSRDGKRIFAQETGGKILAWDSVSGKLLSDALDRMPPGGKQASTPDGELCVRVEDGVIRVYRAHLDQARKQREARDREFLERLARFDPDWHLAQLDEALGAADDIAAAFHLDRLARAQPGDAALRVLAAQVRRRSGRQGDRAEGRQALTDLVQRVQQEKNPQAAATLLAQALAGPWEQIEAASLLAVARQELKRERNANTLHLYGAVLYRAGRYAEAALNLAQAVQAHGKGGSADTWLFQAMTARQQGKYEEADRQLARFTEWHGKQKFAAWRERLLWSALLGEARKLIQTRPPMSKVPAE
jgi:tetratricopeptide (TPR) repeat protein